MKNLVLVVLLFVIGCSESINKIDSNKKEQSKVIDASLNKVADFNVFFNNFNSNSEFQLSSIEFPLKMISFEDENKSELVIEKNEWKFTKLIENLKLRSKVKKKFINEKEVQIDYYLEDTGVFVSHFFIYKNKRWILIRIEDHST